MIKMMFILTSFLNNKKPGLWRPGLYIIVLLYAGCLYKNSGLRFVDLRTCMAPPFGQVRNCAVIVNRLFCFVRFIFRYKQKPRNRLRGLYLIKKCFFNFLQQTPRNGYSVLLG